MKILTKCYPVFIILNIILFSIGLLPVLYITWFLFIPAIIMSVLNFITARDDRYGTKPFDKYTMVFAVLALIPHLHIVFIIAALVCTLITSIKYLKSR